MPDTDRPARRTGVERSQSSEALSLTKRDTAPSDCDLAGGDRQRSLVPGAPPLFPDRLRPDAYGQVASGGTLSVEILCEAYQRGIFPWSGEDPIPWCAPDPRLILIPGDFHSSASLEKQVRRGRYRIRFDHDFRAVMSSCAGIERPGQRGTWITPNMLRVYGELFDLGIAHSVEVVAERGLVGGLYGLTFGRAFFGESMFHLERDTSKLALRALCRELLERGFHFIDCQAVTPHLLRLGARAVRLSRYLEALERALAHPSLHTSWTDW